MATSQQLADELLHHWHLLWPLPPAERIKKIDEIKLDLEYQDTLCAVTGAMWEPQPRPIDKPVAGIWSGALMFNFSAIAMIGLLAWEVLRP